LYNLLIHNARIARPDGSTFKGDVACEDGRIARIDPAITAAARETIDANRALNTRKTSAPARAPQCAAG
jgi:dihydroorotase-like cyclic amidohydrolase